MDAAKSAGVTHIFYSSLGFAGDCQSTSLAEVMQAHLDTERYLAKLAAAAAAAAEDDSHPLTYTSIREGLYAESTPIYMAFFDPRQPDALRSGEICIPHDGSGPGVAWVKRDELGEASARLIASYAQDKNGFPFTNRTVLLTGPRAWSLSETVEVLAGIAGRKLKIREVSVGEYVKLPRVREYFGSEEPARTWATAWDAIREGETAVVTPELERILGRKPEAFEVAVREHYYA